jgi:hypothetical protein
MYYLAFFVDYQPFFKNKLRSWLFNQKKYNSFLLDETANHEPIAISRLLECTTEKLDSYYEEPWYARYGWNWCIHGKCNLNANFSEIPKLLNIKSCKSLDTLNNTLSWFADRYEWSILPWSSLIRFRSFVFISKDKNLRDKFIQCSSNQFNLPFLSNRKYNLLVSCHDAIKHFSQASQSIVFEENIDTIFQIWNACNCDELTPFLITDIILEDYYLFREELKLYPFKNLSRESKIWNIYQPNDKIAFELISSEIISDQNNKTAFWISPTTDLDRFMDILVNTESLETSYSDLIYLKDFLSISEWIYGFSRDFDVPDAYNCSFFACRNSKIIEEVDFLRCDNGSDCYSLNPNHYYNLLAAF